MSLPKTSATLSLLLLLNTATAEDIKPGIWRISLEASVAATPDWKPQPFEMTQCLTANDAKNPDRLLLGMASPGATGCNFLNRSYVGNTLVFDISCPGTLGISGHGEAVFTATKVEGFLDANIGGGAERIDMQNRIHASYLGPCAGADGEP